MCEHLQSGFHQERLTSITQAPEQRAHQAKHIIVLFELVLAKDLEEKRKQPTNYIGSHPKNSERGFLPSSEISSFCIALKNY